MLSYEVAERLYGPDPNPRWVYCHAELGCRPSESTYIGWLRERQTEFVTSLGRTGSWTEAVAAIGPEIQVRFNDWLRKRHHRLLTEKPSARSSTARYARASKT